MLIIIEVLLGIAAALAAVGYVRTAIADYDRHQMPGLLVAFTLAAGFLGLILK